MRLKPGEVVIGMMANMRPDKDHATFLRGAKIIHQAFPQARFAILGDGVLRQTTEEMAISLEIDTFVSFLGHQKDVASYLDCFDIVCLCSKYTEGCSNVLLEAMAMGKPVVATDVGGNREIIEQRKTGLLVPAGDPGSFAESVLEYIMKPDWARNIGQQAKEVITTKFGLVTMVGNYEKLYEEAFYQSVTE
jgi:glycosyltransferase involved in cell wall biosynthesis